MTEIKTIKDCLSKEDFANIKNTFFSDYFSWYLNFGVNNPTDNYTQFTHKFFDNHIQHSNSSA